MSGRRTVLVVACAVALVAVAGRRYRAPGDGRDAPVLTAAVRIADFRVVVEATGELDAARSTILSSPLKGDAATILSLVGDGAQVTAGDVLVELDPTPFERRRDELRARVRELEARVELHEQGLAWERNHADAERQAARYEVDAAKLDLRQLEHGDAPRELGGRERAVADARLARDELNGYIEELARLAERGFVNRSELDQAERKREQAERELQTASAELTRYREHALPAALGKARGRIRRAELEAGKQDKAMAYAVGKAEAALQHAREELVSARAAAAAAELDLDNTALRAPLGGMAVLKRSYFSGQSRKPRVGDTVLRGQPLVYLPDISQMEVRTRVRELDLHKLAVGQPAEVAVDAFPGLALTGRLKAIGVLAEAAPGERAGKHFQVTIGIDGAWPQLRPGMSARATIRAHDVNGAVTLPVTALFVEGGASVVFVDRGDGFERRPVATGAIGADLVEVRDGVRPGEHVALSLPDPGLLLPAPGS